MDQVPGVEMVQALGHIQCDFSAPAPPPETFRHSQDDLNGVACLLSSRSWSWSDPRETICCFGSVSCRQHQMHDEKFKCYQSTSKAHIPSITESHSADAASSQGSCSMQNVWVMQT